MKKYDIVIVAVVVVFVVAAALGAVLRISANNDASEEDLIAAASDTCVLMKMRETSGRAITTGDLRRFKYECESSRTLTKQKELLPAL